MDSDRRKRKSGSSRHLSGNSQNSYVQQTNPLLIDTVLRRLFSFANYERLKEYRLVCYKWKEIIDPMFIKSSVFASENYWKLPSEQLCTNPEDIQSLFMSINEQVRFTAFKFHVKLLRLAPCIGQTYLAPNKRIMTRLELYNIRLGDSRGYSIDELIGPNLKIFKLTKRIEAHENDPWLVSLDKLAHIPQIDLIDCLILINSSIKIAPIDLKLYLCRFKENISADFSSKIKIQDILDFRSLRKLSLQNYRSTDPFINFSDCAHVAKLTLIEVVINLDAKIYPKWLTLRCNRYFVNNHHIEQQFLLNDYLSMTNIERIFLDDHRIVFDSGKTEMRISGSEGRIFQRPQSEFIAHRC